jgi:hypothetical protein
MAKLKNLLAKKPSLVIAFALAGMGSSFAAGLDVARGHQTIGLANIVGVAFCTFVVIIGVKQIVGLTK